MKITELQKKKYENRLKVLKDDEPKLKEVVKNAQDLGDFSENSELDAARSELANNRLEQSSITNILNSSEVVPYDKSNLITIGSLVELICPELNSHKPTVMLISDSGDCILEGVLNTSTPLGKAVLGNPSGEFKVGNTIYNVTKITKPVLDDFIEMYSSDDAVFERYFFSNLNEEKDGINGSEEDLVSCIEVDSKETPNVQKEKNSPKTTEEQKDSFLRIVE